MGIDITTYRIRIGSFRGKTTYNVCGCTVSLSQLVHTTTLIALLLIMAGIEQNPGPKSKGHEEATASKGIDEKQKSKSLGDRFKSFLGFKEYNSDKKALLRPKSTPERYEEVDTEMRERNFSFDSGTTTPKSACSTSSENIDVDKDKPSENETKVKVMDSFDGNKSVHSEYTVIGDNTIIVINKETEKEDSSNDALNSREEAFKESLKESLQAWVNNANFVDDCPSHLLDLIIRVEASTESSQFWSKCLGSYQPLDRFLQKLLDNKTHFETSLPVVKYYLERLILESAQKLSYTVSLVKHWLQSTRLHYKGKSVLTDRHMTSVADLVTQMHVFLTDMQIKSLSDRPPAGLVFSDLDAYITSEMALAVHRLFKKLECTSDWPQSCFLRIVLFPLSYRKPSGNFEIQVKYTKLQDFVKNTEQQLEMYNQVSKKSELKLQAFLIDLLLTFLRSRDQDFLKDRTVRENIFTECLKPIDHLFVANVSDIISKYASENPFEFEKLHQHMKNLLDTAKGKTQSSFDQLRHIFCLPVEIYENPIKESNRYISVPKHVESLLAFFRLENYFPGKINLQQLMAYKCFGNHPGDIPWKILQKLIVMDYRARDEILDDFYSLDSNANFEECNEDDKEFEEFLDDFDIEEQAHGQSGTNVRSKLYNPLDVLAITFCCCDYMLKQVLFEKMYLCKLAVPFIYPCPTSENLYCAFWSMRSIKIDLKDRTLSVVSDPIKRVAFVRIDRPPFSKSRLMNTLLNDTSHDTFSHKDSSKFAATKMFSDGLVEAFWSVPSRQVSDEVLMFLNLRGNAVGNRKQIHVLSQMVELFVVIIDVGQLLDSNAKEVLDSLYIQKAAVILILTNESRMSKDIPTKHRDMLKYQHRWCRTSFISVSKRGEMKTEIALREKVLSEIKQLLLFEKAGTLEDCEFSVRESGIINEERQEGDINCVLGKEMAKQVVPGNISSFEMKHILLPLQNEDLWGKWSRLHQKQCTLGEKLPSSEKDAIREEMNAIRRAQIQLCKNLSPYMNIFLRTLLEVFNQPNKVIYFCNWLKLILDAYSGNQLPKLHRDFQRSWEALTLARRELANEIEDELKQSLLTAEKKLCNANFGIEHLFREVGQIYEAIIDSNEEIGDDLKSLAENLPKAVAKLVINGHPLELMDGDAVSVPLTWIKAVFRHLKTYTGEKKILTVSTIGGQSTGKSTLLNSMFGVSFPVKAGRCTRGLFMQLLPRKRTKHIDFDYVLIIDTEGLKLAASILDTHDLNNNLAALGIGIADITIVNVQGEKVDVQEVLQVVVHGFFRLHRVNPRLNLNKHCVFLQQNVEASNAETNLAYERQRFEEELDTLTKQAADQVGVTNIRTFKQVIDFDSAKHFWYFNGFWYGAPPKAPVNREYSRQVEEVKTCILEEISNKIAFLHSMEDISIQFEDLWTGILSDNLVYTFRNIKEWRAFNNLTRKCNEVAFKVEDRIHEEEKKLDLLLPDSDSEDVDEYCKNLENEAEKAYDQGKQEIDDFIQKNELRDFQLNWRDEKIDKLSQVRDKGVKAAIDNIKETKELQAFNIAHKHKTFLIQLYREANLQAEDKHAKLNDRQLNEKFEEMWVHWVNKYRPRNLSLSSTIEDIVKSKLYDFFQSSKPILDEELRKTPLSEPVSANVLEGTITNDRLRQYRHTGFRTNHLFEFHRGEELQVANTILRKVDLYLNDLKKKDSKFDATYVSRLLRIVVDDIEKHKNLLFVTDVSLVISVHVCRYALPLFKDLNDQFEKKHSIQSYADTFKDSTRKFFLNVARTRKEVTIAASLFCELLNIVISSDLASKVQQSIERNIMENFSYSKAEIIAFIMRKLLSPESKFETFQRYFDDPYTFAFKAIGDYTDTQVFGTQGTKPSTKYTLQAKRYLDKTFSTLLRIVSRVTTSVTSSDSGISVWIDEFTQNCDILPLSDTFFQLVKERNVSNLRSFEEIVCRELDDMKKSLLLSSEKITSTNIVWHKQTPCQNIMDKLWGCEEKCPFCHEPCGQNDKYHLSHGIKHSCWNHKPPSLRGVTHKDAKYAFYLCNQLVQTSQTFKCVDCNYECRRSGICKAKGSKSISHKFNEYSTIFPSWNIENDGENCIMTYWKWFLGTFNYQLKNVLEVNLPKIPPLWRNLERKDANDSIPRTEILHRVSSV